MGPAAVIFIFWMLSFKPVFSFFFTLMKRALYFLCFLPLKWYYLCFWGYCYFSQQSWFQFVSHSARHFYDVLCSSVQFSCSVVSDSLWPHGLQHARPPSPSLTPKACSNSCPSSRWCHPIISSSVVPFSSCLQSVSIFLHLSHIFFPMSQFFASGGQRNGALTVLCI